MHAIHNSECCKNLRENWASSYRILNQLSGCILYGFNPDVSWLKGLKMPLFVGSIPYVPCRPAPCAAPVVGWSASAQHLFWSTKAVVAPKKGWNDAAETTIPGVSQRTWNMGWNTLKYSIISISINMIYQLLESHIYIYTIEYQNIQNTLFLTISTYYFILWLYRTIYYGLKSKHIY